MSLPSRQNSQDRPIGIARHGKLKRPTPVGSIIRFIAIGLAVILVATLGVSSIAVYDLANSITNTAGVHLQLNPGQTPPAVGSISGGVNMLLVGTDTRSGQGAGYSDPADLAGSSGAGNNDVTILIHITANHQSAMVVSLPRDTIISMPACEAANGGYYPAESAAMLNSALSRGGLSCAVQEVEHLTGVSIPYAAEISFDGVADMSDAVGGVTVCVADPIDDTEVGLHLTKGEHTLIGVTALKFLRSRHGIADGSDLGRISSQEVFLSALVRKIESGGVLSNPLDLYSLATAAVKHMTLSSSLEHIDTLVAIAGALKGIALNHVVMMQWPTETDPTNPNRVIPMPAGDAAVNAALLSNDRVKLSGTTGRGSVVEKGSGSSSTSTATPAATSSSSSGPTIVLPASVTGQNAAQQTCAKGNATSAG